MHFISYARCVLALQTVAEQHTHTPGKLLINKFLNYTVGSEEATRPQKFDLGPHSTKTRAKLTLISLLI